jgi:hypothetical protein
MDRLVLRGELRVLYAAERGMPQFLKTNGVLLKDFREYVHCTSTRLKEASLVSAPPAFRRASAMSWLLYRC